MRKMQLAVSADFKDLLKEIKTRIQQAQTRAILAANAELVRLYWDIGRLIHERQQKEGWGAAVIPRLAKQLQNELSEEKGFSERNIKRMLAFYRAYQNPADIVAPATVQKVTQAASQVNASAKVTQPASLLPVSMLWSIPWFHHIELLQKIKDRDVRLWYMLQTLVNGWSRPVMLSMIQSRLQKQPTAGGQRKNAGNKSPGRRSRHQRTAEL